MNINQKLRVKAWVDDNNPDTWYDWVDITDGIISVSTKEGNDFFQGFWDQPETGQFTIVSRNPELDPSANNIIRSNRLISITTYEDHCFWEGYCPGIERPIFVGFVSDFNIEHRKDENPLITINGTNLLGIFNRNILTQEIMDTFVTPTYPDGIVSFKDFLGILYSYYSQANPDIYNFFEFAYGLRGLLGIGVPEEPWFYAESDSPLIKLEVGKTFLDLIRPALETGLISLETPDNGFAYYFYPYYKYDPTFSGENNYHTKYYFKSSPEDIWQNGWTNTEDDLTYKFININDGFDRLINQIEVTNTNPLDNSSQTLPVVADSTSITSWGPAKLTASTIFNTESNPYFLSSATIEEQVTIYENDILDYQKTPKIQINSITVDMNTQSSIVPTYKTYPSVGDQIYIQHKVNDSTYVAGDFVIVGIKHTISFNSWLAEYILRESEYADYEANRPKDPVVSINATSGDTNTVFTASITNYSTEELANIEKIEWMVNSLPAFTPANPPSEYKILNTNGFGTANIPIITGKDISWTYGAGGILANYALAEEGWGALVGPGEYQILVFITNKDGYRTSWTDWTQTISIIGAQAHADFVYSKDEYDVVTFTDASGADTNSWHWDFGDGTTYDGKTPPKHEYAVIGTHDVTLTVTNLDGDIDITTKQVTTSNNLIPVRYIRIKFNGSVTKQAGETDYSTDLVDTIGGFRIRNTSNEDTGGNVPIYMHVRTLDKVELILDERSITPAGPAQYTTNYASGGPLDPMSQNAWSGWNTSPLSNVGGGVIPKYKYHPVITNNPDGSQTKTYDFDLILEYLAFYSPNTEIPYYRTGHLMGQVQNGGDRSALYYWPQWGSGGSSAYNQRFKIQTINPHAAVLLNDAYGYHGTAEGKTYLPVTIAVSHDGIEYRKIADATWSGSGAASVSYVTTMPPTWAATVEP